MAPINCKRGLAACFLFFLAAGVPRVALASGFALLEQNSSGMGNAYSGTAAVAEDASTVFFNPAGMSYLPGTQFSSGVNLIKPSAKFNDNGSVASGVTPPNILTGVINFLGLGAPYVQRPLGNSGGDAGSLAFVPNMYITTEVNNRLHVGIGVNAPFGQETNYAPDWMGRFQALKSSVRTMNINPSVSYKLDDMISLGFGANYQRIDAEFSNAVNYAGVAYQTALANPLIAALPPLLAGPAAGLAVANNVPASQAEGTARVKGGGTAWGWNAGVLMQLGPKTRLGFSYRSAMRYHIGGTVIFTNAPAAAGALAGNGNVYSDVKLPDIATFSVAQGVGDRVQLLADAAWTGWSSIRTLSFYRENGALLQSTPENFRNTWRFALGLNFKASEALLLRTGVAYDQTPVNSTDITPRLPDSNRKWFSLGLQYKLSKAATAEVAYTHLFIKEAAIHQNGGDAFVNGQLNGTYKLKADLLGLQLAYKFF